MAGYDALVLDLDGTLSHADPIPGGRVIAGTTGPSFLAEETLDLLAGLSEQVPVYIATARSKVRVTDHVRHFADRGIRIRHWILEYGTIISGHPQWTDRVLADIRLDDVHKTLSALVTRHDLKVDTRAYRQDHHGILVYSAQDRNQAGRLVSLAHTMLAQRFRIHTGRRKLTLIPATADKYRAFRYLHPANNTPFIAAGDSREDLPLLTRAGFAATLLGADPRVVTQVRTRNGCVSTDPGHTGSRQILDAIRQQLGMS